MTDIIERLHVIRNHFRTGALGQREMWEEWLTEAADEVKRLRAGRDAYRSVAVERANDMAEVKRLTAEIERHMREKIELAALVMKERDDNERLQAALKAASAPKGK